MSNNLSSAPGPRVTASADRCAHDLLHCVKCGTATPGHLEGRNRHWPNLTHPRRGREWMQPLASRAGRRAGGRTRNAFRGAKSRAVWTGHPLGLPTDHGRVVTPSRPRSVEALARAAARTTQRQQRPRMTRGQFYALLRDAEPGITKARCAAEWRRRQHRTGWAAA